jgi:two-component system chemotaxis response regulator CheB
VEVLAEDPSFEIVGQAGDGIAAIRLCEREHPDVISLDMVMPAMSGLEVTRRIMSTRATPILVVSASVNRGEAFKTLDALQAGAVDVFEKTRINHDTEWIEPFKSALRLVSRIRVVTRPKLRSANEFVPPSRSEVRDESTSMPLTPSVVALGASTGGPAALARILADLPPTFPIPVLIALHLGAAFSSPLVEWLGRQCALCVRMAVDGEPLPPPRPGSPVLIAPPDHHLLIDGGRVRLTLDPERHSCRPSVDVLFESLAVELGPRTVAGLLTGMGRDGAAGLLLLHQAHARTFAQDEASSAVFGMPKEAISLAAAETVLPLSQIGPYLIDMSLSRIERRAV